MVVDFISRWPHLKYNPLGCNPCPKVSDTTAMIQIDSVAELEYHRGLCKFADVAVSGVISVRHAPAYCFPVQPSKLNSWREIQPKSLLSVEQEVSQHGFAREPSEPDFGGVVLPKNLYSLTFGCHFNQSLQSLGLPRGPSKFDVGSRIHRGWACAPTTLQSSTLVVTLSRTWRM